MERRLWSHGTCRQRLSRPRCRGRLCEKVQMTVSHSRRSWKSPYLTVGIRPIVWRPNVRHWH